jgi:hypothetical protein
MAIHTSILGLAADRNAFTPFVADRRMPCQNRRNILH